MRAFLNSILSFIYSESLTDDEFATVTATVTIYDQATYDDLARILGTRENVSVMQDRLTNFYQAKGVQVKPKVNTSNILIGGVL